MCVCVCVRVFVGVGSPKGNKKTSPSKLSFLQFFPVFFPSLTHSQFKHFSNSCHILVSTTQKSSQHWTRPPLLNYSAFPLISGQHLENSGSNHNAWFHILPISAITTIYYFYFLFRANLLISTSIYSSALFKLQYIIQITAPLLKEKNAVFRVPDWTVFDKFFWNNLVKEFGIIRENICNLTWISKTL